jgi:drug/metabolite transporter (DMT)-like permease
MGEPARSHEPRQGLAYVYALATVLIWSTVASAFKLTLRELGVVELLAVASATSVVVMAAILAVQGRLHLLRRLTRADLLRSAWLGLLNPFGYYLVLFEAYDRLPAQEAQTLNYTWAITLSLLAVPLLGQRLRWLDLAGLVVAYSGALVIATRGRVLSLEFSEPIGVGLALGSTVIWALYWIENTRDRLDPVLRLLINFAFGTVYVLIVALLTGARWALPWAGLGGALYVGVFEMGITFALWIQALKLSQSTARVGILIYLSPFLSLVFIRLLVDEPIYGSTIVGLALIVAGIAIQKIPFGRSAAPPS